MEGTHNKFIYNITHIHTKSCINNLFRLHHCQDAIQNVGECSFLQHSCFSEQIIQAFLREKHTDANAIF